MLGAHIHATTFKEYVLAGQQALLGGLATKLKADGKKPYIVAAGGSNAIGTFGYVAAVEELRVQMEAEAIPRFDHIVVALGSVGTALGKYQERTRW